MALALVTAPAPPTSPLGGGPPPAPIPDGDLERIIKLIPGEVVALYTAAMAFGPSPPTRAFALTLFLLGVALVPLILWLDGRQAGVRARWPQYVVRTLAFAAWAFAISDPLAPTVSIADVRWLPGLAVLALPIIGSRVLR